MAVWLTDPEVAVMVTVDVPVGVPGATTVPLVTGGLFPERHPTRNPVDAMRRMNTPSRRSGLEALIDERRRRKMRIDAKGRSRA